MNNLARHLSFDASLPRREINVARAMRLLTVLLLFALLVVFAIGFPSDPTPGLFGTTAEQTSATAKAPSDARPA